MLIRLLFYSTHSSTISIYIYSARFSSSLFDVCFLNSSIRCWVADFGWKRGLERSLLGNSTRLSAASRNVYGVHGPWIDGKSVCISFLYRLPVVSPACVLTKCIHFMISSLVRRLHGIHCLSPFTKIAFFDKAVIKHTVTNNILQKLLAHDVVSV